MGEAASLGATEDIKVAKLAAHAYDAARSRGAAPRFTQELCEAFDGALGFVAMHDYASSTCELLMHDAPMPPELASYAENFSGNNPWLSPERIRRDVVWCGDDVMPEPELVQTDFYRSWLKPWGLRYSLVGAIARQEGKLSYVALLRSCRSRPFARTDKLRLRRLIPHLQALSHLSAEHLPVESATSIAFDALEHLPFGVIALDAEGKVRYASRWAREILKQNDGLTLRGESLGTTSRIESMRLSGVIASVVTAGYATTTDQRGVLAISRPSGARPYVLQIFARGPGLSRGNPPTAGAVVFVHDPEGRAGMDGEWLRTLYRLTPAEAKMAGLLSLGLSASNAAQELGITINTARTHLKHLYSKTGTSRQPELVRLLVSMRAVGSSLQYSPQDRPERGGT